VSSQSSVSTLTERYGAPAPWRRRAVVAAAGLVALVFLAWLGWTAWGAATPAVDSELVSFTVQDEHAASAVVDVRLHDDDVTATCLLRATAEDHTVVGELSFTVQLDTAGPRIEQVVRTERRATAVELLGCTAPGQSRPR